MLGAKRWSVHDRYGHHIYFTDERWQHIIAPGNHPEMADYEELLQETIAAGSCKQDSLNARKYRYSKAFGGLVGDNTHLVAIVAFGLSEDRDGRPTANSYVVTAYLKETW